MTLTLIASGHLSPDWRPSFLAVPREAFIPDTIWRPGTALVPAGMPRSWRTGSGPTGVTSIEIDPDLAANARKALSDAGFGAARVITGDGARGDPSHAPYHRVIATVARTRIPYMNGSLRRARVDVS